MISWITEEIAVGDSDDAKAATTEKFEATLNVAVDLDIKDPPNEGVLRMGIRRHKVGLVDGRGNDPLTFAAAILLLESLVRNGKKVLVHCHAGQSRSVMVAAAWVAYRGYSSLDDALWKILPLRKVDNYRQDLYNTATIGLSIAKQLVIPKYEQGQ